MTKEEVEKLRKDAEAHAEEDRKAREAAEIRNNADTAAYQSEKQLRELGDKLSADQKQELEAAIKDVREKLNGSVWVIGTLLGISLICSGISRFMLALAIRKLM